MNFLLFEVFKADEVWQSLPKLAEQVDEQTARAILDECAKISEQKISPIARQGDEIGVRYNQGKVSTAPGYKHAFNTYVAGGWPALGGEIEYGGMGMPKILTAMHEEMLCSADISFALYPSLTAGAALSIAKHGSEELKQRYLTKMYSGQWSASMCLTEAHSGSDLGLIRTKAISQLDGSYSITGSKIFITGGEHDLTENIIHLVLAKLPDAPAGPSGISLFLVPKLKVNQDEALAGSNNVTCGAIEHKMGIHASATCVMNFDGAQGFLVGELNKGLACMFTMMNFERIGVGIQGLGAAVRSYQNALAYAKDRQQGRSLTGAKSPEQPADPIMVHGDVRRMLLNMKALNEGSRALSSYISMQLDYATYAEGKIQTNGVALSSLLTPIAKAFFTDLGFENTVTGQQVFGGHGYIREWGQEQLVRDARITQIYEGTNGIQAKDLLLRKVVGNKGAMFSIFCDELKTYIESCSQDDNMAEFITPLRHSLTDLMNLTTELLETAETNIDELGGAANDYLHIFGYTAMAYVWAKMAQVALQNEHSKDSFYRSKLHTARYYFTRLLPRRLSLIATVKSGSDVLFAMDDDLF